MGLLKRPVGGDLSARGPQLARLLASLAGRCGGFDLDVEMFIFIQSTLFQTCYVNIVHIFLSNFIFFAILFSWFIYVWITRTLYTK